MMWAKVEQMLETVRGRLHAVVQSGRDDVGVCTSASEYGVEFHVMDDVLCESIAYKLRW